MAFGYTEFDITGNRQFIRTSCPYCRMDTAWAHKIGCPAAKTRTVYKSFSVTITYTPWSWDVGKIDARYYGGNE